MGFAIRSGEMESLKCSGRPAIFSTEGVCSSSIRSYLVLRLWGKRLMSKIYVAQRATILEISVEVFREGKKFRGRLNLEK